VAKPSAFVKVPMDRIGALVGPEGFVKESIEKKFSVELQIDSGTGDVTITLRANVNDPSLLFKAREVVTAIARGFSPENALRMLSKEEALLFIIDLHEIVGKSQSDMNRLKGRVIGQEGKTRRIIEELTNANITVYGHTISIIGNMDELETAKEAVQMLLRGSQHRTVYRYLHRKRRELKEKRLELWEPTFSEKTETKPKRANRRG